MGEPKTDPSPALPRKPRITFAVPFFQDVGYLSSALGSVLRQSRDDWAAVVVDDSRGDAGARELVEALGDARVGYLRNADSHGIGTSWNRCFELARTELVTILHADDELCPQYADRMIRAADRHPEPTAFFCGVGLIDERGRPTRTLPDLVKRVLQPRPDGHSGEVVLKGESSAHRLVLGNFLVAPSLCYRLHRLGAERFSTRWRFVLDLDFYLRLLIRGDTLLGIPEVALLWRRHERTTTARLTRTLDRFREEAEFLEGMAGNFEAVGWLRAGAAARRKTLRKLHLAFLAVSDLARLRFREARPKLELLLALRRRSSPR
jgi:glycosyltransferase involved in cell wall biosynthesis